MKTTNPTLPSPLAKPGSGAMFDRIAGRYDLLNRLMSFGLDTRWRRHLVKGLELKPGSRVLDLATGTADVALEILRQEPDAQVIGLDPSPNMLDLGREKVSAKSLDGRIELRGGIAEELPFEDDSFDGVTISYGIRNVPDRPKALQEMNRVVKPGGRICILEATEAQGNPLAFGARFYVHQVIPRIGAWLSGAKEYRYLQSSIAAFPAPADFEDMMRAAGLEPLRRRGMTFGANTLFIAEPGVPS
ncbi:MAG: bifunctional demethylmenaquinone methyltransferase/2-methoxy-6-polyprenyl-1,4-benzoquinol methylase UbiE [Acidobacteriota bacterium]